MLTRGRGAPKSLFNVHLIMIQRNKTFLVKFRILLLTLTVPTAKEILDDIENEEISTNVSKELLTGSYTFKSIDN